MFSSYSSFSYLVPNLRPSGSSVSADFLFFVIQQTLNPPALSTLNISARSRTSSELSDQPDPPQPPERRQNLSIKVVKDENF